MDFIYNDGGRRNSGFKSSGEDCVCRAISIASGIPYKTIYKELSLGNKNQEVSSGHRMAGRRTASHGIDVSQRWFKNYMKSIGFIWVKLPSAKNPNAVFLGSNDVPGGHLVLDLGIHAAALIDGVLHDLWDCTDGNLRHIEGYWRYKF